MTNRPQLSERRRLTYVTALYLIASISLADIIWDFVPTALSAGLFALNVVLLVRLIENRQTYRVVITLPQQRSNGDR